MAVTWTSTRPQVKQLPVYLNGGLKIELRSLASSGTYSSGGDALSAANLGMGTVIGVIFMDGWGGFVPEYDRANSKLKLFYGNYDAADGVLIDVAAGVTPGITAGRCIVLGF